MLDNLIGNLFEQQNNQVEETKKLIKEVYLSDNRPWVVGYSGGKDSTVVVQLVFETLSELSVEELHKKVYVISSDTLVETPLIINSIDTTLRRIQEEALKRDLPIETHKVKPQYEQSFWSNIIGKGYPSPNQSFRWCTDRLKIEPANAFIMDKVSKFGEVVMVLGVRENESQSRDNVLKSHTVEGKELMRHTSLTNAFVFAPIRKFSVNDVWDYLLSSPSPWGNDNHELNKLYQDSSSGECPLVVDKNIKESAGSCGNSRFGCWVCTVVNEDKALNGFIISGSEWLKPLLAFRNWLASIRDDREMRMKYRMGGQIYFNPIKTEIGDDGQEYVVIPKKSQRPKQYIALDKYTIVKKENLKSYLDENNIDLSSSYDPAILIEDENGAYGQLGLGPYTMEARKEILKRLLEVQKNLQHPEEENFELIKEEELRVIRRYWLENGDWEDSLPPIFEEVMGYTLDWEQDDRPLFDSEQLTDLESLCQKHNVDFKSLKKLISLEKNYAGYKVRRGLMQDIEKVLKQDYLHL
ncbi:DNA phosphorothioation system sulfurtransferase DndC [Bacillus inaquosorum]|uniref:DNA phosphorothioation system sulfurtransferase DndC n=1 Tax=Bacillus inaquosorum TaxID=483913 RepID=UPI00227DA068|nr:DNA phosphorothioation system sulfurtransferase DndC [Bacillus inaquosorum]MCY7949690.1 DNA phosphorothioation system sulfurtransferase DndC [Bacillus inaquosorum]MEC0518276.1 DNA phosphorothioation system sulfurtransferase DndC [Bacillus inaquosorum]MEC0606746.1 DNA phosphorothioation system sulfurtransferase DndC [Bacillus inaquosorum]